MIPTDFQHMSLDVAISAIRSDHLGTLLNILNTDKFRVPLELAPGAGSTLAATSLMKDILTQFDPDPMFRATHPGILASSPHDRPDRQSHMMRGHVVFVGSQADDVPRLTDISDSDISVDGDRVFYGGRHLDHTYVVLDVTVTKWRGIDAEARWAAKYREATTVLGRSARRTTARELDELYDLALGAWLRGTALLGEDSRYLDAEKSEIERKSRHDLRTAYERAIGSEQPQEHTATAAMRVERVRRRERALGINGDGSDETLRHDVEAYSDALRQAGLEPAGAW